MDFTSIAAFDIAFEAEHGQLGAPLFFFRYGHLPEGPLRDTSRQIAIAAVQMHGALHVGAEKSAGMRKLLEAKDCFVRAAL